jgi:hypothetical protein
MSDYWEEFHHRVEAWRDDGDVERLKLADQFHDTFRYRETNPEFQFELLTRLRDESRKLNEPWWVLFFEEWRLAALTADLHDFVRGHELAMELMVRFSGAEGRAHPMSVSAYTSVLYTYTQVDPVGHKDTLQKGFSYLDQQIAMEPVNQRFVLFYRWTDFLCELNQWPEAYEKAQEFLAMVDRGTKEDSIWWRCWVLFLLCQICDALSRVGELASYAQDMAKRSAMGGQLLRTRAAGWVWLAVTQRLTGKEQDAARSFLKGLGYLKEVKTRDEVCADAAAKYYALGRDWAGAIGVRDRELTAVAKNGMLHRCCLVQMERCRLLAQAGELSSADIEQAKQAIAKMRVPEWYLGNLAQIQSSLPGCS